MLALIFSCARRQRHISTDPVCLRKMLLLSLGAEIAVRSESKAGFATRHADKSRCSLAVLRCVEGGSGCGGGAAP